MERGRTKRCAICPKTEVQSLFHVHLFLLCSFSSPGHLCFQPLGCTLVSELSGACSNWQAAVLFSTVGWTAPSSTFCYSQAPPANCFLKWGENRWRAECSSWQIPQHCKYDSPCCKQGNAKWRRWFVLKLEKENTQCSKNPLELQCHKTSCPRVRTPIYFVFRSEGTCEHLGSSC